MVYVKQNQNLQLVLRKEIKMTLFLRIAWRNVWRQRRRTFLIAIGMGVTMTLLVFYDGLIGGFEQAIYGNAI